MHRDAAIGEAIDHPGQPGQAGLELGGPDRPQAGLAALLGVGGEGVVAVEAGQHRADGLGLFAAGEGPIENRGQRDASGVGGLGLGVAKGVQGVAHGAGGGGVAGLGQQPDVGGEGGRQVASLRGVAHGCSWAARLSQFGDETPLPIGICDGRPPHP